ncbi:MAG: 16S rRNA (guanine(527)-N(7))-methyltransferase RsmG [Armatimonadota bacterium]
MNRIALSAACGELGISLSEEQLAEFEYFEEDLYEANEVMNLTRVPKEDCTIRHFLDSIIVGKIISDLVPGASILDIGCGPGFPSWPIALAFPDMTVTALDANGKMLGFLDRHRRDNLTIEHIRAEDVKERERFDAVTGRAVAPFGIQLEISAAQVKIGGYFIPMRTPTDDMTSGNWTKLGLDLIETREQVIPGTDVMRAFPIFKKNRQTPPFFPRRWPDIKKKPL